MSNEHEQSNPAHPAVVLFTTARSPLEARIIVAVLADAGIPAFVPGGLLMDEFAVSQRLMNVLSVEVYVPGVHLEGARAALEASRRAGEAMADDDSEPPASES